MKLFNSVTIDIIDWSERLIVLIFGVVA